MMTKEKLIFGLLIVLIILGVGGCASNTKEVYSDAILGYLQGKYGEEFEILQMTREFSGNEGIFVRAVCQSNTYPEKCVVYAYKDYETEGAKVKIGRKTYTVVDDYADIIFSYEYTHQLQEQLGDDVFIKSRILFDNHTLTTDEFQMGLSECLQNPALYSYVMVYVIVDKSRSEEGLLKTIEELVLPYNAFTQYVYVGYSSDLNMEKCANVYYENQNSFDSYLFEENNELVEWVDRSYLTREEGVVRRFVEER